MEISINTVVNANNDLLSVDIDDEKVMLDLESTNYYGLDPISSRILALVNNPISIGRLCSILEREYEVSTEKCFSDVTRVVNDMLTKGILSSSEANL